MDIIEELDKEFDERFVTMTMGERAMFEKPDRVKDFYHQAIRRVLEELPAFTDDHNEDVVAVWRIKKLLTQLEDITK